MSANISLVSMGAPIQSFSVFVAAARGSSDSAIVRARLGRLLREAVCRDKGRRIDGGQVAIAARYVLRLIPSHHVTMAVAEGDQPIRVLGDQRFIQPCSDFEPNCELSFRRGIRCVRNSHVAAPPALLKRLNAANRLGLRLFQRRGD